MTGLHLLANNRRLTPIEYAAIRRGIDQIASLHAGFREYVVQQHLDPDVFLPGGAWRTLYDFGSFENWTYDLVNIAKCVYSFTGFDPLAWGRTDNGDLDGARVERFHVRLRETGILPENIDAVLDREFGLFDKLRRSDYLTAAHAELVRDVPDRYVARCPDRMGEIGIVHDGRIINPDLLTQQSRLNALVAGGVLDRLEHVVRERGSANVLEIGPGLCFLPYALQSAFAGKLKVYLIDLPRMMAHGYAYLCGNVGAEQVHVVTRPGEPWPARPFVFIANYIVPACEAHLPSFDLVFNTISLNEMNSQQIAFYLDLIDAHLAPTGVFFLEQGAKYLDTHEDAFAAARQRFPRHIVHWDSPISGVNVMATPSSYFYANRHGGERRAAAR